MYFNTSTYNTYRCTVAGNASTAKWVYTANIKGQAGTNGVSITGVEHQYYLSTSSTSQAGGSWTVKPATYVKGRYYWERWKINFSSGDPTYTTATLAEEVTSAWAAIEQNDEAIALKANSSDVYTKSAVDGKITQEVSDRNAAITAKANEITSTVSQTYTTKEEFENLEVGGRNLVWDTAWNDVANRWLVWGSPTTREIVEIDGKRWLHLVTTTTKFQGYQQGPPKRAGYGEIQAGDTLTISFTAYATVATSDISCIGVHWQKSDGSIYSQTWITTDLTTVPKRFVKTVSVPDGAPVVGFNIMVGDNSAVASELWISEVKLEKGNKATDWTPAPEDIETRVSSAESAITQNANNIALKVSESDVTGNYVVGKINLNSTTASIAASHINLQGAVTISDLASDAQNATLNSNISVGGRNLLQDSKFTKAFGAGRWTLDGLSATLSGNKLVIDGSVAATGNKRVYQPITRFSHVTDTTYTFSCDIVATAACQVSFGRRYGTTNNYGVTFNVTTTSQRISGTYTATGTGAFCISGVSNSATVTISNPKLEIGNTATDWSPAPEDVEAYADESAYLSAKPNIAPIGSVEFSDVYDATTNPDGYWQSAVSAWFTQLNDGWIHVYKDNSSGASSATGALNSTLFRPSASPSVFAGKVYTILTEIRNNASTGTGTNDFYLQQINNNQFWGNTSGVVIDDDHVTTTTTVSLLTCGQSYVLRSYRIADTDHLTAGTPSSEMFRYNFRVAAGGLLDFDFRMSVYEGIYDGPYKPYSGTQLFATQTNASDAAKTATSYVTNIDNNGITIHPSRSDYATNGGRAVINSDGLTVYVNNNDVASYGTTARIGKSNSDRVTIDSTNGITIYKSNQSNQGIKKLQTTTNGIDIYGDDGITNIASFGSTTRIGAQNNVQVIIESGAMSIENENDEELFKVEANRSGTTTETITANDVAVWSNVNDVTTTNTYRVDDTSAAQGAVTAIVIVDNTQYELDSSQVTTTVTVGSHVTAKLTDDGVSYVQELMTIIEEDDEGVEIATYQQCSLSVTYFHTIADSAILTMDGRQVINGVRSVLTLNNDQ